MTIKQKLQRYANLLDQARDLEYRIAEIKERMTSISSTNFDNMPICHGNNDKLTEALCKLKDLGDRYIELWGRVAEEELEITNMINKLDYREQKLIRLRYVDCKPLEEIACILGYTYRHTSRIYKRIYEKLEKMP